MKPSGQQGAPDPAPAPAPRKRPRDLDTWLRHGCTLVVAGVAAYASYVHQRTFALQGGADTISASLWPLSVDGLLLLATAALLRPSAPDNRQAPRVVWLTFLLGIVISLVSNIAAAPALEWRPVLVAGWPPVALLLSVHQLALRHTMPNVRPRSRNGSEAGSKTNKSSNSRTREDPLLERAHRLDARHRELHHRPVSAEALRKELHIGATRSRRLVTLLRARTKLEGTEPPKDTAREQPP
ncbi:DUF2637 domain-containing protein [Streptomyces sp. NPDC102360]|uniref:DUF2637 domain-containing protein n=1 Tax=Streptomyces sp. NPDC102360 TaxID=3366160 RepID=UPI0037F29579